MLTPAQIDDLTIAAGNLTCDVQEYLLASVCQALAQVARLTSAQAYQVWRLRAMGVTLPELEQELQKRLSITRKRAGDLVREYLLMGWEQDAERLLKAGLEAEKIKSISGDIRRITEAAITMTDGSLKDITKSLGMIDRNGLWHPLRETYLDGCDRVWKMSISGAESWQKAVQDESRSLWSQGVRVIDYESGVHTTVDVAVRRACISSLGAAQAEINTRLGDELGLDGMEITAHAASAPDHEPIQGKQYRREAFDALNAGLKRRIGTLNCGHAAFPVLYGTAPQYTDEELKKFRDDNAAGVMVDGKSMSQYEATQYMRAMERRMRKQVRRAITLQSAGDADGLARVQSRLTTMRAEYRRFARAAHLTPQLERVWIADGRLEV